MCSVRDDAVCVVVLQRLVPELRDVEVRVELSAGLTLCHLLKVPAVTLCKNMLVSTEKRTKRFIAVKVF